MYLIEQRTYAMYNPGFVFWPIRTVRPTLGPNIHPIQFLLEIFSPGSKVHSTAHVHLVPRIRIKGKGTLPLLHLKAPPPKKKPVVHLIQPYHCSTEHVF